MLSTTDTSSDSIFINEKVLFKGNTALTEGHELVIRNMEAMASGFVKARSILPQ